MPTPFISHSVLTAGTEGKLTCIYSLSPAVDTHTVALSATWTVNGSSVIGDDGSAGSGDDGSAGSGDDGSSGSGDDGSAGSGDERISTDRLSLTLSPLTTSDSGTYTCTLTLISLTPYVTVLRPPQQSLPKEVYVYSKTYYCSHVL